MLRGEIQIFGTINENMVMIMNPSEVALTRAGLNQGCKTCTLCTVVLLFIMLLVIGNIGYIILYHCFN